MGTARTRANNKYNAKAYDRFLVSVPKGDHARLKTYAAEHGFTSFNQFVNTAIEELKKQLDRE